MDHEWAMGSFKNYPMCEHKHTRSFRAMVKHEPERGVPSATPIDWAVTERFIR